MSRNRGTQPATAERIRQSNDWEESQKKKFTDRICYARDTVKSVHTPAAICSAVAAGVGVAVYVKLDPDYSQLLYQATYEMHRNGSNGELGQSFNPSHESPPPAPVAWAFNLCIAGVVTTMAVIFLACVIGMALDTITYDQQNTQRLHHRKPRWERTLDNVILDILTPLLSAMNAISLLLLLAGLVAFIWTLDKITSAVMAAVVALLVAVYVIVYLLCIWRRWRWRAGECESSDNPPDNPTDSEEVHRTADTVNNSRLGAELSVAEPPQLPLQPPHPGPFVPSQTTTEPRGGYNIAGYVPLIMRCVLAIQIVACLFVLGRFLVLEVYGLQRFGVLDYSAMILLARQHRISQEPYIPISGNGQVRLLSILCCGTVVLLATGMKRRRQAEKLEGDVDDTARLDTSEEEMDASPDPDDGSSPSKTSSELRPTTSLPMVVYAQETPPALVSASETEMVDTAYGAETITPPHLPPTKDISGSSPSGVYLRSPSRGNTDFNSATLTESSQTGPLPCTHQSHTMNSACAPPPTPSEIGPYVPVNCQKSPCPALNALCNHGAYGMPRDGENVHALVLARALVAVYGLGTFFAYTLAFGSILAITKGRTLSLDLKDLRAMPIAHQAALVHVNPTQKGKFTDGRPSRFFLNDMFQKAGAPNDPNFNLENWAKWCNIREYSAVVVKGDMPKVQAGIAAGELALFLQVFGDPAKQFAAPRTVINEFFGDEKLPNSWLPQRPKPTHQIGFRSTLKIGDDVRESMAQVACRNHTPYWFYLIFILSGLAGIVYIWYLVSSYWFQVYPQNQ